MSLLLLDMHLNQWFKVIYENSEVGFAAKTLQTFSLVALLKLIKV